MKTFEEFINKLLVKKTFPGISILAGKNENILLKKHYGWKSLVPHEERLEEDTLYDLASLTKPLITALLTVYLSEKEKIPLETPAGKIFPHLPAVFDFTLLELLTHTSGLPAWYPFYLFGEDYLAQFPSLRLEARPGQQVNYSCVGYILLYYFIEKIGANSFTELSRQVIIEPLGLKHTYLRVPNSLKETAAPTEQGTRYEQKMAEQWAEKSGKRKSKENLERVGRFNWRTGIIQGETHDCNSYYLGGTAGNAGLFSTTGEVFRLCREFFPSTASILKTESLRFFHKNYTPFKKAHRTVGFKRNSSLITSGGRAFSRKAIGHNGFTGTSVWLDPEKELTVIILTNRIHPEYKEVHFDKIRRKLHRLLLKELNTPTGPGLFRN